MPTPDPRAVWIERQNDSISAFFMLYFWTRNDGNRKVRAEAIL